MKRLIAWALHRPLLVALGLLLLALAGAAALRGLPVESIPDATDTQVAVIARYPGRTAEEIERQVTLPIEGALSGLPNATHVFSHTQFGLSFTVVTYDDAAGAQEARQQIGERLRGVEFPPGVEAGIAPDSTPTGEILRYRVRGDGLSSTELRSIQDGTIGPRLRLVPGVAGVVTRGGAVKQYEVQPDLDRLRDFRLGLQDLLDALRHGNSDAAGSYVAQGAQQYAVHGTGLLRSADDIGRIVVSARGATPVHMRDVARVQAGTVPRPGTAGQDLDDDVVTGIVVMRKGDNPAAVLRSVKESIAWLNDQGLPPGVRIATFYDRTWLMDRTQATVVRNLVAGALLVPLVLWVFFSSVRASLAAAAVIPVAMLSGFLGLGWAGVPASLSGLGATNFGAVAASAAIVIENILRRLSQKPGAMNDAQRRDAIVDASAEAGRPVLLSVLVLIAAHIPVFALQRHEGRIFQPLAQSTAAALIGSLVFSLTLVPLLTERLLRRGLPRVDNRLVAACKRVYAPVLERALAHRTRTVAITLGIFALALVAASRLGSEFMPEADEGAIWINLHLPSGVSNEEAARILHTVRKALLTVPEVRTTVSQAGPPEDGSDPKTLGMAEIYVDLKPAADWRRGLTREQLVGQVDLAIGVLPGLEPSFSQPIRDNVLESTSQIDGQIVIQVAGDDLAVLRRLTESIAYEVKQVPGVFRAGIDRPGDQPQLAIDIDRERAARHGLQVSDVQDVIEAALAGKPATFLWEDERKVQVVVRLPPSRRAIATLGATPVATADGAYATLGDLADIRESSGAANITREAGRRSTAIGIFIKDRDMGSVVADMQARVAQHVRLPRGYTVAWSGEFQNQERAMSRLATVAPVPLLLVLVLLVEAFRSFRAAVLILLTVPLAMAGGFIALWMLDIPLSVPAAVGFIVLSGLSMFNSVLMLSEFQKLRGEGLDAPDAAREGSVQRLRAVLMTALLAALGLLPMAISHDIGSEIQRPLAIVVIGGLLSATLFTLAVLPVLYAAWFAPKPGPASEPEPQGGP